MTTEVAWISYLTALGPLFIGAFVAYVAFSQWQVARATFAEKLFDKRYRIVKAAKALALHAKVGDPTETSQFESELRSVLGEARYLFDREVEQELHDLVWIVRAQRRKATIAAQRGGQMRDDEWIKLTSEQQHLDEKIESVFTSIDRLTEPYLRLSDPRVTGLAARLGQILGTSPYRK